MSHGCCKGCCVWCKRQTFPDRRGTGGLTQPCLAVLGGAGTWVFVSSRVLRILPFYPTGAWLHPWGSDVRSVVKALIEKKSCISVRQPRAVFLPVELVCVQTCPSAACCGQRWTHTDGGKLVLPALLHLFTNHRGLSSTKPAGG